MEIRKIIKQSIQGILGRGGLGIPGEGVVSGGYTLFIINFVHQRFDDIPVCRVCPGISDPVWDQHRAEGLVLHCSAAVLHLYRCELSLVVVCQDPVLSCLQTLKTKNCHTGVMVHYQSVHEYEGSWWKKQNDQG